MSEQNRPYQCLVQVYFGADTERIAIPHLCREFITEQASPILCRTSGRQQPLELLLTAKVDELFYSFNWYTVYEDFRRRVTCAHVLEFCLGS